jgi:hypothetical protein
VAKINTVVFWVTKECNELGFKGACCLHLQGRSEPNGMQVSYIVKAANYKWHRKGSNRGQYHEWPDRSYSVF